jgi:hypothetical protein
MILCNHIFVSHDPNLRRDVSIVRSTHFLFFIRHPTRTGTGTIGTIYSSRGVTLDL